jgi:hypothetical protein
MARFHNFLLYLQKYNNIYIPGLFNYYYPYKGAYKMNRKPLVFGIAFFVFFIFLLVGALITSTPVLADVNDTVTIDVNVSEAASIVVLPDSLNWSSVDTGQEGVVKQLNIKNAGSINVSQIYAYVDTLESEPSRPYGSAESTNFSAGGVIALENETDPGYFFAGRIEWNWTQDIPNHDWTAVDDADAIAWGYLRNTSSDYVWVLGNGTAGRCNETSTEFAVEYQVDLGTTATRTPVATNINRDGGDGNWSYFSVNDASSPLDNYCVATYWDCSKIYIYHYDKRTSPNFNTCNNAGYLQEDDLTPGYTIILNVGAWVPNGYPAGSLNTSIMTVYASS